MGLDSKVGVAVEGRDMDVYLQTNADGMRIYYDLLCNSA